MLYNLARPFAEQFILFNLFRYITFRSGAACLTALVVSFWMGPGVIRWLKTVQRQGQPIRIDGPERHLIEKKGTPTMGGLLILFAMTISTFLWVDLKNLYVWAVLFVTWGYGLLGFADDYLKVTKRNHKGVSGRVKLAVQAVIGLAAAIWIVTLTRAPLDTELAVPVFKEVLIQLGWFFPVFGILVMMGASNAVNLTDGLDGLAIVPTMIAAARVRADRLPGRQPHLRQLPAAHLRAGGRRACGVLLRPDRRRHGLPVVQRAARRGVHGRHRLACRSAARSVRSPWRPSTRSS